MAEDNRDAAREVEEVMRAFRESMGMAPPKAASPPPLPKPSPARSDATGPQDSVEALRFLEDVMGFAPPPKEQLPQATPAAKSQIKITGPPLENHEVVRYLLDLQESCIQMAAQVVALEASVVAVAQVFCTTASRLTGIPAEVFSREITLAAREHERKMREEGRST